MLLRAGYPPLPHAPALQTGGLLFITPEDLEITFLRTYERAGLLEKPGEPQEAH